ncbi:hypothetical protein, partial [Pseudomonas sp. AH2 (2023)]|uniref:hypothetical protein n=1 Tax=Pseudomonas sp. AH2 (2023) TaxID=3048599 RepID=UPI002B22EE63
AASLSARETASALGHRLAALRNERDNAARRVGELAQRSASLALDREREARLGEDAGAALARLEAEMADIAARIAAAEASRATIDIRTV